MTSMPPQFSVNRVGSQLTSPHGSRRSSSLQRFRLFIFQYRGPLHRGVIRICQSQPGTPQCLSRAVFDGWTSISILCFPSSFCVPQVLRIATIATTNVALAKDEPLGGCCQGQIRHPEQNAERGFKLCRINVCHPGRKPRGYNRQGQRDRNVIQDVKV